MALLQDITVPLLAVNDTTLTVVEISVAAGAQVRKGDQVMVFETSKTTYEVQAEADGYIQFLCEIGQDYEVNEIVAKIFSSLDEFQLLPDTSLHKSAMTTMVHADQQQAWTGETIFSPAALELMKIEGLHADLFLGIDFVSLHDVRAKKPGVGNFPGNSHVNGVMDKQPRGTVSPAETPKSKPTVNQLIFDNATIIAQKLSANKKREIEYLSSVQSAGLISTINSFVDTDGLFENTDNSFQYLKGSLLPLIIYEAARLLKKYPLLNAFFNQDNIAVYRSVDIGFAIDVDKGLKVLRIPEAATASLRDIEETVMTLSERYLDDKLKVEDLTNISFTITDLSAESVSFFTPLVNMMNSAILGVSSIDPKLDRCILSLSFDHRVTEGKAVAQFLAELKFRLESYRANHAKSLENIQCSKCFKTLSEDLGDVGFVKNISPQGTEGYLCQSCLKGF